MTTRDYYSEMICILRIIHRLRNYPWISAQTMDPSIAQADPWISQIHRLRPTAARPVLFRWIYDYYYNAWFFYVSYFIVLMIGTTNTTTCWKERNYLLYQYSYVGIISQNLMHFPKTGKMQSFTQENSHFSVSV